MNSILQEPYNDYSVRILSTDVHVCFSWVLLFRKTLLILLHTDKHTLSARLALPLLLWVLALVLQTYARPFPSASPGPAFVSSFFLGVDSTINLVKALFVTMTTQSEPAGSIATFSRYPGRV